MSTYNLKETTMQSEMRPFRILKNDYADRKENLQSKVKITLCRVKRNPSEWELQFKKIDSSVKRSQSEKVDCKLEMTLLPPSGEFYRHSLS